MKKERLAIIVYRNSVGTYLLNFDAVTDRERVFEVLSLGYFLEFIDGMNGRCLGLMKLKEKMLTLKIINQTDSYMLDFNVEKYWDIKKFSIMATGENVFLNKKIYTEALYVDAKRLACTSESEIYTKNITKIFNAEEVILQGRISSDYNVIVLCKGNIYLRGLVLNATYSLLNTASRVINEYNVTFSLRNFVIRAAELDHCSSWCLNESCFVDMKVHNRGVFGLLPSPINVPTSTNIGEFLNAIKCNTPITVDGNVSDTDSVVSFEFIDDDEDDSENILPFTEENTAEAGVNQVFYYNGVAQPTLFHPQQPRRVPSVSCKPAKPAQKLDL